MWKRCSTEAPPHRNDQESHHSPCHFSGPSTRNLIVWYCNWEKKGGTEFWGLYSVYIYNVCYSMLSLGHDGHHNDILLDDSWVLCVNACLFPESGGLRLSNKLISKVVTTQAFEKERQNLPGSGIKMHQNASPCFSSYGKHTMNANNSPSVFWHHSIAMRFTFYTSDTTPPNVRPKPAWLQENLLHLPRVDGDGKVGEVCNALPPWSYLTWQFFNPTNWVRLNPFFEMFNQNLPASHGPLPCLTGEQQELIGVLLS